MPLAAGGDRRDAPLRVQRDKAKEFYGLPHGLDGDIEDPTRKARKPSRTIRNGILGRNAARAYNFDPDQRFHDITCDQVNELKTKAYMTDAGTEREGAPLASRGPGARTRREVVDSLVNSPWSP